MANNLINNKLDFKINDFEVQDLHTVRSDLEIDKIANIAQILVKPTSEYIIRFQKNREHQKAAGAAEAAEAAR